MTRRCLAGARKSPLPASGPLFCVASERFCARRNAGGMRGKGRGEDSERKKLFQSIARCRRHRVRAELTSGRRVRLVDVRGAPGGPVRLDARGDLSGVYRLHGLPVRRSSCLRDPLAPHLPALRAASGRCFVGRGLSGKCGGGFARLVRRVLWDLLRSGGGLGCQLRALHGASVVSRPSRSGIGRSAGRCRPRLLGARRAGYVGDRGAGLAGGLRLSRNRLRPGFGRGGASAEGAFVAKRGAAKGRGARLEGDWRSAFGK